VTCLSEGTAPSVIEQLANVTGRATEQTVLTCKIDRGKPEADIKWCVCVWFCYHYIQLSNACR